jgi:hypothetical protein
MPKIIEIKNFSGRKSNPLTIHQLESLCGLDLFVGTYSELNEYKTKLNEQYLITINNFGRVYLGVEYESVRGVQVQYVNSRDLYHVTLRYPCGLHDISLFDKLVDAISKHTGTKPTIIEDMDGDDDPLIIWREFFNVALNKADAITIEGIRLELSFDSSFLSELETAENLLHYFHNQQWLEGYYIPTPILINVKQKKDIAIFVNTIDLPAIYPIKPSPPENHDNLNITNWLLFFHNPISSSVNDYCIEYDKFIESCNYNEIDVIGTNHIKITTSIEQMEKMLEDHGRLKNAYLE